MDLAPVLREISRLEDLPRLIRALGHEPRLEIVPPEGCPGRPGRHGPRRVLAVGRSGAFPWFAIAGGSPALAARRLARRMLRAGRPCGVLALHARSRRLGLAVAFEGAGAMEVDLDAPGPAELTALAKLAGAPPGGALAYAALAADALSTEMVGQRFFREFRSTLERMASGLPGSIRSEDRHAFALLQLTRVLFLYFVQTKGWLAGRSRFLAEEVDRCLARRRRIHRDLLRPLFFGTLNLPAAERGHAATALGPIPFLNGGLFEPHALERRVRADISNDLWRDAFDRLFERFRFVATERADGSAIAPDMLGRVFEGVMEPAARRSSGTYYTPAALVRRMLDAALVALLANRLGCGDAEAERRLDDRDSATRSVLESLSLLDPAAGSGAFLLGALERLSPPGRGCERVAAKREILRRSLFGVDRSATAVRLSELRLWLAVIADDPAERPDEVRPLPNLDCLVRQGDSLFDPVGPTAVQLHPDPDTATALARLRSRAVTATGSAKAALLRELREVESLALRRSFAAAELRLESALRECVREGRATDLFGERRGLDRTLSERLRRLRADLRAVRRARRQAGEGDLPWFHFQSHFADVFLRGGFDLVIGNPPWRRAEEIPTEDRRRLMARYRWWRNPSAGYGNRPDLAVAFLERACELAAPHGTVAFLVPAKLASATYGTTARHALATEYTLRVVADLTVDSAAAFDATVYPLALVVTKAPPVEGHCTRTALAVAEARRVPQTTLAGGGPWLLLTDRSRGVLESLRRDHPDLAQQFRCHLGVKTGANRVFLDPPDDLEPEVLRWAVRGRDLQPFRTIPSSRLLWTHDELGRPRDSLPPRAAAYLARHAGVLRRRVDLADGPAWTLFRTAPAVAPHRVVWADLARRLEAAALSGARDAERIPLNTCYVVATRSEPEAARLAAWLNSSWVRAAARAVALPASSGYARFTATAVGAVPLPASVLADPALSELAESGRKGTEVQRELDEIAARHLGLGPRAQAALRGSLAPRAENRR